MSNRLNLLIAIFFQLNLLNGQDSFTIKGATVDSCNHPLDYVNIGIVGKNFGTVSNDLGFFELNVPLEMLEDSLTFSRVGYRCVKRSLNELRDKKYPIIALATNIIELGEVQITSRELKRKKAGVVSNSNSIVLSITSGNLGREIGTTISLPENPVALKDFNFHIAHNRPDSAILRLNMYEIQKRDIGRNLLDRSITFVVRQNDLGDHQVNLSRYGISVRKKVFVSVEIVAVFVSSGPSVEIGYDKYNYNKILVSGAIIKGKRSYYKEVSLGSWEKCPVSFSPGFWLTYTQ